MTSPIKVIDTFIPGIPKATPRTRSFSRNEKAGVYTPKTADDWKSIIALYIRKYHGLKHSGPVRVELRFYLPRPKRLMRKKDPDGPIWHTSKPDKDNLEKAVLDIMTNCQIWEDDSQVCSSEVNKYYCGKSGRTGLALKLYTIDKEI